MTQKLIILMTYNEGPLFQSLLCANRALISKKYDKVLRSCGLSLITTAYTSPIFSIDAQKRKDEEASVSMNVKAILMGDLGGDLDRMDKVIDKD